MVTITIGVDSRVLNHRRDIDESWITQEINGRLRDGQAFCVKVSIRTDDVDILLSTGDCPKSIGGGRKATGSEVELFELWNSRRLNVGGINAGNLIAFLKQIPVLKN